MIPWRGSISALRGRRRVSDAALLLVTAWQGDERPAKKPAYWTATRKRARIELKVRGFSAALQAAEEVLT
ncbi:MAG: hypothetical protein HC774_05965, partial [Sphingomonadales bacterium]|nr:hypothetical protein [Sphingomonadales bacterium]